MHRIGFIGLGMMGTPMASNLLRSGFDVLAYDLQRDALDGFVQAGGRAATALTELVDCDAAIVMVNTDSQAREVIGALLDAGPTPPFAVLSMSTILPSTARDLGNRAAAAGVGFLDAPVSGGPVVAQFGALAIMAGGDVALFERARPVFAAMGQSIHHVGEIGTGLAVKLVNNMIAIQTLPVVAESLRVGVEQGMDLATLVGVIQESSGDTWITRNWDRALMFLRLLMSDRSQLDSLVVTGRKDLELARAFCAEAGLAAPVLEQAITTLDEERIESLRQNLAAIIAAAERS
jgi:2-hydroxy-3-oxopropionate reductase